MFGTRYTVVRNSRARDGQWTISVPSLVILVSVVWFSTRTHTHTHTHTRTESQTPLNALLPRLLSA